MNILIGTKGLNYTQQEPFLSTTSCHACKGKARIAFVAYEDADEPDLDGRLGAVKLVCDLHSNNGKGGGWPHDCCSFAVYICGDCYEATTLWNQS